MRWPGRGALVVLAVAAAAGVSAGLVIATPGSSGSAPRLALPRARVYKSVDACLLTGPDGVQGTAAQAWAGMEDASRVTAARVSYLAVTDPATEGNAASFLGSLLVRGCRVIVAWGGPERAAVLAGANRFPKVRFVVAGNVAGHRNVTGLAFASSGMNAAVAAAVESGVRAAGG